MLGEEDSLFSVLLVEGLPVESVRRELSVLPDRVSRAVLVAKVMLISLVIDGDVNRTVELCRSELFVDTRVAELAPGDEMESLSVVVL